MRDKNVREQLKAVRDELGGLRDQRASLRQKRDDAKEAFPDVGGDVTVTSLQETPAFKDAMEATRKLGTLDDQISILEANERGILELLGQNPDSDRHAREGQSGSYEARDGSWDGHALLRESESFREALGAGTFSSRQQFGSINLGAICSREQFLAALPAAPAGTIGTVAGGVPIDNRGIIPPALRRLSILDLIPTGTTDSNMIEYVQVSATPQSAAETAEGTPKPQGGLTTVDATAPVRTIPTYVKLNRQAMEDVAGLATLINTLLPYDVRRRMEAQILAGSGAGQNLRGILNTSGIGAPAAVTGDNVADAILRAMTTVILSDNDPNFVALNPLSWQNLLLMREASVNQDTGTNPAAFRGEYLYGSPGMVQSPTIWGLSITSNRVVPQGSPLVGDSMGATLLIREGVNIKTSDSDQDDFTNNRVTVLAEARAALPVWRPTAFAVVAQG